MLFLRDTWDAAKSIVQNSTTSNIADCDYALSFVGSSMEDMYPVCENTRKLPTRYESDTFVLYPRKWSMILDKVWSELLTPP